MTIYIFNSITNKKEIFKTLEEGLVKMYVCGPTVYNYIHIGNARPAVVFDTIRRYLEFRGYKVKYISNFTDVDDRIVKTALQDGISAKELSDKYVDAFFEDIQALSIKKATYHPRVTETIPEIINFIDELIEKKYAYVSMGDVYFRTKNFKNYGKLSKQPLASLFSGVRKKIEENKEDETDFALWKRTEDLTELHWDSPWSKGRPGWHIECSAMIKKYLGESIDIHAGGIDLKFPHHENEIAQSEAATGKVLANYWLHNAFINIDNKKMSKSLDNFLLLKDIRKKINPEIIRFWLLSVHYRQPINYSDELIENAINSYNKINNTLDNLYHRLKHTANLGNTNLTHIQEKLNLFEQTFINEMNDDFNTANAITSIFNIIKMANDYLENKHTHSVILSLFIKTIKKLTSILGIEFQNNEKEFSNEINNLLKDRELARKNKNFNKADEIRNTLKEMGIFIEDTNQGVRIRHLKK